MSSTVDASPDGPLQSPSSTGIRRESLPSCRTRWRNSSIDLGVSAPHGSECLTKQSPLGLRVDGDFGDEGTLNCYRSRPSASARRPPELARVLA